MPRGGSVPAALRRWLPQLIPWCLQSCSSRSLSATLVLLGRTTLISPTASARKETSREGCRQPLCSAAVQNCSNDSFLCLFTALYHQPDKFLTSLSALCRYRPCFSRRGVLRETCQIEKLQAGIRWWKRTLDASVGAAFSLGCSLRWLCPDLFYFEPHFLCELVSSSSCFQGCCGHLLLNRRSCWLVPSIGIHHASPRVKYLWPVE